MECPVKYYTFGCVNVFSLDVNKFPIELKYGELKTIFDNVFNKGVVPYSGKESDAISIFKKREKSIPENYRGITLLNSGAEVFTRTSLKLLYQTITIRDQQQGFRKNRSTIDATNMCFIGCGGSGMSVNI